MRKPIFLLGLPRSGSTLWTNIIRKNGNIFIIMEMHFLSPWRKDFRYLCRKRVGDLSIDENVWKMLQIIFECRTMKGLSSDFFYRQLKYFDHDDLKQTLYDKIVKSDRSLASIFKTLIEEITYYRGYNRCCVKFPVFVNYIDRLLKWYPECKIIHVTRDPRAMAVSKTGDPGGTAKKMSKKPWISFVQKKKMMLFVILQYVWSSKIHEKYKSKRNYALFRYEDLLYRPEEVIKKLCSFAEINFTALMLEPERGQASSLTGRRSKGFDKKAASRWKSVISPLEEMIITLLTGKSMKRFEYDRKKHSIFFDN